MYPSYTRLIAVDPTVRCDYREHVELHTCSAPAHALLVGQEADAAFAHPRCVAHILTAITSTGADVSVHPILDHWREHGTLPAIEHAVVPAPSDGPGYGYQIAIAGQIITDVTSDVCRQLGYTTYSDRATTHYAGYGDDGPRALLQALGEGMTGLSACLRAIVILADDRRAVQARQAAQTVADTELHAARVRRQAETLANRRAGISTEL